MDQELQDFSTAGTWHDPELTVSASSHVPFLPVVIYVFNPSTFLSCGHHALTFPGDDSKAQLPFPRLYERTGEEDVI